MRSFAVCCDDGDRGRDGAHAPVVMGSGVSLNFALADAQVQRRSHFGPASYQSTFDREPPRMRHTSAWVLVGNRLNNRPEWLGIR